MDKTPSFITKFINSTVGMIIISALLAVTIWGIIVYNFSDNTETTFSNIPVSIDTTNAEENSFYAFYSADDVKVDVRVSGKSFNLFSKQFSANNIVVTASSGYVDSSGYKSLTLTAVSDNPDITITSINPQSITIFFDRKESATVNVEAQLTNDIESLIKDGFTIGKITPSISTVTVEGPANAINGLEKVVFTGTIKDDSIPLEETTELDAAISFETSNVRGKNFLKCVSLSKDENPTITIPVLKKDTVKTSVKFLNQPSFFKEQPINVTISPSELPISYSTNDELPKKINIGTIDFKGLLNEKNEFVFPARSNSGYSVIGNIPEYKVVVDLSDFSKKTITTVPSNVIFTGTNNEKTYRLSSQSGNLSSITVLGPQKSIEEITADDLQIEINVSKLGNNNGFKKVEVSNISLPKHNDCWVYGDYYCYIITE